MNNHNNNFKYFGAIVHGVGTHLYGYKMCTLPVWKFLGAGLGYVHLPGLKMMASEAGKEPWKWEGGFVLQKKEENEHTK